MVTAQGSRFEKFSEEARRVLNLAQEEARQANHNYIGTEHILLGLVRETEGVAARVLSNLAVDLGKVRSEVEFIIGRGERPSQGEIGLTPRAKKAVELAVDEARRMNATYIGTEHLLIGILREGEGVAANVLESLGVTLDKVRAETNRIFSEAKLLALREKERQKRKEQEKKASLATEIDKAAAEENWLLLEELTEQAVAVHPQWFYAATLLQMARIEIAGVKYPDDPEVQRALEANRLVRKLAHELGLEHTGR